MKMRDFSPSQISPITRMDDLLNKNEQIYRNLRTKLQGIAKSSECIHRNIDAIYSYSSDAEQVSRRTYEFVPIQHNLPVQTLVSRIQAEEIKLQQLEAIQQELEQQKARDVKQQKLIQRSLQLQREQEAMREIKTINEILSRNQVQIDTPALMNYISPESPNSLRKVHKNAQNDKKQAGSLKSNQVYLASLKAVPQATPDTHLQSGSFSGSLSQKEEISFKNPFNPPTKYQKLTITPDLPLQYCSTQSLKENESEDYAMQQEEGKSQMFVRSLDAFQKQIPSPEEPQCFVFLPFNKLYRSPILQIIQGVLHLRRLSKTVPMERTTDKSRIVDSIKYRIKNLFMEEAVIVNRLFYHVLDSQPTQHVPLSTRVLIVGLSQTLKRKQHMSLLGHAFSQICNLFAQDRLERAICNVSHSWVTSNSPEQKVESEIEITRESRNVGLMRIQKCIQAIYAGMNRCPQPPSKNTRLIRVSKISLFTPNELLYNIEVTCTNNLDYSFIDCMKVDKICFSLNPLTKNYDDVKRTLDLYHQYVTRHNIRLH